MSTNFVGSISVMDRGDAPAQAVLDRNARSLAKRVADETKEELGKVMKRVEYVSTYAIGLCKDGGGVGVDGLREKFQRW